MPCTQIPVSYLDHLHRLLMNIPASIDCDSLVYFYDTLPRDSYVRCLATHSCTALRLTRVLPRDSYSVPSTLMYI
jgi:hypothetical protein